MSSSKDGIRKVCEVCGEEYKAKRADSRTCGDTCKKQRQRDKGDIKGDKQLKGTSENVPDNECKSNKGDKYCSCGARIWPVLHPMGPHEVIYDKETWFLQSYYVGYVPEITNKGIDVGECRCGFCATKRKPKPVKEKVAE